MKLGRARAGASEALAMLRQARYLLHDLEPTVSGGAGATVVLLHGLYATAGVFRPLREDIERELRFTTASFSYGLGPGVLELSERTAQFVSGLAPSGLLFLVGHSVGGLVACHAAHFGALRGRVTATVTLAAPFRGSRRSWLAPGAIGRDIEPSSALLRLLAQGPPPGEPIPRHLSITAEDDVLIESNAFPDFGERISLPGVGHNGILFDERGRRKVVEWVGEGRA